MLRSLSLALLTLSLPAGAQAASLPEQVPGLHHPVALELITDELDTPWSLALLPSRTDICVLLNPFFL